ncbi:hypothetical protein GCM10010232_48910 [Streptomyces amakusaensis]|uniref:GntR family transcriptional regulator n=1 Tax=Streptomyces amakusaensis TaxID=67271 RepID=A0ABW0AMF8_9ACTN
MTGVTPSVLVLDTQTRKVLRADFSRAGRLPQPGRTSPPVLARNAAVLTARLRHWVPVARACRHTETSSPTATARWNTLLAEADRAPDPIPTTECVIRLATALRELLRAITLTTVPGPTIADVTGHLTAGITSGRYPAGAALSPKQLTTELGVARGRVQDALDDLTATRKLEMRGTRYFVPATHDTLSAQARYLAGRIRAQIAAGLHQPGGRLPAADVLTRLFVCQKPPVTAALHLLADARLLDLPVSGRAEILPAARALPPGPRADPLPPGTPYPTVPVTDRLLHTVRQQWLRRTPVTDEDVHTQWLQLRTIASAFAPADRRAANGTRAGHSIRVLTELAGAALPEVVWLRPWHLAVLAAALRTARSPAPAPHPGAAPVPAHGSPSRTTGALS